MSALAITPTPRPAARRPGRSVWALVALVAGLLLAGALVAVLLARRDGAPTYPANSPEGTVQRFMASLQNGQLGKAYSLVLTSQDESQFDQEYSDWGTHSHQVSLVSSERRGDTASVTVDVSGFDAGPLGASNSSQRVTFLLTRSGRGWLITDPPYLPY